MSETICAIATPAGDGAIGVLRISGAEAIALLCRVSSKASYEPRRITLTQIRDPLSRQVLDQAMVCTMPAPRSYTGENLVEIYAHGGQLNMQQLLDLFVRQGARQAEPGEFTRRAFLNGRIDLTQAEAVAEVIAARSGAALHNARAALGGALGRRVRALRQQTLDLGGALEACIDFADDVEQPVSGMELRQRHDRVIRALEQLVATYAQGRRLNGLAVALIGQVNAGKSSLLNALHGTERALVSEQEGTTRDYLEVELTWQGHAVTLVDTAGDRQRAEMSALERAGHALGSERVQRCDAVILVVDVERMEDALSDEGVPRQLKLVAAHKADLLDEQELARRCARLRQRFQAPVVATSVRSGEGLAEIKREVVAGFARSTHAAEPMETVKLTQARQHDALCRALDALRAGEEALGQQLPPELVVEHTREALAAMGEVTGESYTEALLDSVFSRFCIGK
jgi:tRNA modification GTPase